MGCIGWCFFREASSPRRTGQSEIFNGLVLRGSSVSLIETARPRRGGRNRIFRVELRFGSNGRASERTDPRRDGLGCSPQKRRLPIARIKTSTTRPSSNHASIN
jgi:hypothetical protein